MLCDPLCGVHKFDRHINSMTRACAREPKALEMPTQKSIRRYVPLTKSSRETHKIFWSRRKFAFSIFMSQNQYNIEIYTFFLLRAVALSFFHTVLDIASTLCRKICKMFVSAEMGRVRCARAYTLNTLHRCESEKHIFDNL